MAIVINGSGTVTGLAVGGLPDGTVDAGTLAANSVDSAELIDGAVDDSHMAAMAASKLSGTVAAARMPTGSVVQVVSNTQTVNATITSTSYTDTGLSASITPSSTSNKVLVLFSSVGGGTRNGAENDNQFGLTRDNGSNFLTVKRVEDYDYGGSGHVARQPFNINYLDSPSSTSSVTYKVYGKKNNSSAAIMGSSSSSITEFILMEIAG